MTPTPHALLARSAELKADSRELRAHFRGVQGVWLTRKFLRSRGVTLPPMRPIVPWRVVVAGR